jgi:hypothetical protein
MDNKINVLEEFSINELEDRVEFGLCGGGGGGGEGGGGSESPCADLTKPECHAE